MPSSFPTALDVLAKPAAATLENEAGFEHDIVHTEVANAVEAVQAALGAGLTNVVTRTDFTRLFLFGGA